MILDIMMPKKDGFEVLKEIRRDPRFLYLPVIILTARTEDRDVFESYHLGADVDLSKPFNPGELILFKR